MVLRYRYFGLVLAVLIVAACSKDEGGTVALTAHINPYSGGGGKLQLDEGVARWSRQSEEQVNINGTDYKVVYTDATTATISNIAKNDGGYTAIYPASAVQSAVSGTAAVTMRFDSVQPYRTVDGMQQVVAPMAAHTDGGTISFTNLGSVMCLTVTNTESEPIEMKYIRVGSSTALLSGEGRISFDGTPTLTMTGGNHAVRLQFATGQEQIPAGESRTYQVVLPSFNEADLQISLCANTVSNNYCWSKQNTSTSLPAGWVVSAPAASGGLRAVAFEGEGTEENPYKIGNSHDLAIMASKVVSSGDYRNQHYLLTNDIDCSSSPLQAIGDYEHPFNGVFDGASHTITIASIIPYEAYAEYVDKGVYYGLFARMGSATIRNLNMAGSVVLEDPSVISGYPMYLGAICARTEGGLISGCNSSVDYHIEGINSHLMIGGICGLADCEMTDCSNSGNINVVANNAVLCGGVVGCAYTYDREVSLSLLRNSGSITIQSSRDIPYDYYGGKTLVLGGVVGYIGANKNSSFSTKKAYVINCSNTGSLSGCDNDVYSAVIEAVACGGIVGCARNVGVIGNCYNSGSVKAIQNTKPIAAGIIGYCYVKDGNKYTVEVCMNTAVPTYSENAGSSFQVGYGVGVADVNNSQTHATCKYCLYPAETTPCNTGKWTVTGVQPIGGSSSPSALNALISSSTNAALYIPW